MGTTFSHIIPCLNNDHNNHRKDHHAPPFSGEEQPPIDETLGHSFRYIRSSSSPNSSSRFLSPLSQSFHHLSDDRSRQNPPETTVFRSISGAYVSANTLTPRTVLIDDSVNGSGHGFDCTSSFYALPLQPLPRGDSSGFFLSGPIESGSLSGRLDSSLSEMGRVPFSAPLSGLVSKKKRKSSFSGVKRSFHTSFSEKKRPWVVPVGRKESEQWALGKAGEDRVHVVVSEEHGWLFVGIYDGFNGPDAPEFLMGHFYRAVFNELKGLFWDAEVEAETKAEVVKRVTFELGEKEVVRRKLWEFLAENDAEDGLDLSGSDRFAFSVEDAVSVSNVGSVRCAVSRRSLLLSKLKQGLSMGSKEGHGRSLFRWRFGVEEEEDKDKLDSVNRGMENENENSCRNDRRRKVGPVDHELVMKALSLALEKTEQAYLDLTDKVIDQYPELALMGSCLLAVLMRDDDVYVMNVGDSRAIVAQFEPQESCSSVGSKEVDSGSSVEGIVEELTAGGGKLGSVGEMKLTALQLSTDHCTSIAQEVLRIKSEHPDDRHCIVNDRVKGRLKVTRAFGAGFLKQPKFNDALLEMFRNEFIGNAPYVSCMPSLCHHKLGQRDQFLVLSSDGLYQYLSNQEVVSFVDNFMEKFPDGDPAQHLIEELLNRAAKKAGMDFHDLLDIPQGDRRKYHDDVTVMVISLEGRIWKSSGKYP